MIETMCCAVCKCISRREGSDGSLTYEHGKVADHEAVPVPLRETVDPVLQCDFCSDPASVWTVYVTNWAETHGNTTLVVGEDWGACETCGELISAGKWDEMTKRAIERVAYHNPSIRKHRVVNQVRRVHKEVREHFLRIEHRFPLS